VADALTETEARQRAALLDVTSYEVALDLTADPAAARSAAVIRFRCRAPGAATFADLTAARVRTATLNGVPLDPAAVLRGGRLRLTGLAAENVLAVEADVAYSGSGQGLARIARDARARPAGGIAARPDDGRREPAGGHRRPR
jgi:aminopeptidase N